MAASTPFVWTATIALALATWPVRAQVCLVREGQKIPAPDATAPEQFGNALSGSGDRFVVGHYLDFGNDSGSAYIFRDHANGTPSDRSENLWVQEAWLAPSDGATDDRFGYSVSIEKSQVAVGAPFDDDAGRNSGSAYVFRFDDNGTPPDPSDDLWVEEDKLTALDASEGDIFGVSVSISVDRAIVGALEDDDAGPGSGSAYVFRRDRNDTPHDPGDDFWVQESKLTPWDGSEGDGFGISVAIRGRLAVVGARADDDAGSDSGSAYVFRHDDSDTPYDPTDDLWVQEAKLTASDAAAGDQFGTSVSISDDRAVVGAHLDDDALYYSGSAYVFRRDDNATPLDPSDDFWVQEDKLTASDAGGGDRFGVSVSISSDRIVVGATWDDDACSAEPTCDSGSAYVFRLDDNGTSSDAADDFWVQQAKLVASDMAEGDVFGASVSICGDQAIVGAHLDDDYRGEDSGSVYTFSIAGRCTDLLSFANLQSCFSGDGGGVLSGCQTFSLDGDNDVDLDDYHLLLLALEPL
ncbi:MAG: FG-GAP repeat protein [Phycisphaerales bacterium]|nr:MAG: FG-GAP repeat protein [Phycisphaerales bacterium]